MDENTPEWAKEGLPEDLHSVPFLKDSTSMDDFKLRLTNASQHMGNSVRIPGPDANDEVWAEFNTKMQAKVPNLIQADLESEEGQRALFQKLGLPAELAEYGAGEEHGWLAQVAFDAGLTKNQFTNLVSKLGDVNTTRNTEKQAANQVDVESLYTEWGLAKPNKIGNIEGLLKLTDAPESILKSVNDGTADATTLKWLDGMASQFAEVAKFKKDENDPGSVTPTEALAQIQELISNPEYFKSTPMAMEMRKKMLILQKAAHPESGTGLEGLIASGPELMEMFEAS